jgi:hypothetical protein
MTDRTQAPSTDATKALNDEKQFMLERSHDDSRISNEHMRAAGQAVILISGGAASAVLAYLTKDKLDPHLLFWAPIGLIGYVAGIVAGAFMLYWSARSIEEYSYAWRLRSDGKPDDVEKTWQYAFKIQKRGRIFFGLSICFFGAASIALAIAFFNSTPPQLISAQAATTATGTPPAPTTPSQATPSTSAPLAAGQYLNAVLEAAEKHAGLGGWVGAIGALLAIVVTWNIARAEYNRNRRLERERRRILIKLMREATAEYDPTVRQFIELYNADSGEVADYRGLHAGDPAFARMVDFNRMPVTQWPTVEAYDAFKRYFEITQLLQATPLSELGKQVMPDRRKKYQEAHRNLESAWRVARREQ